MKKRWKLDNKGMTLLEVLVAFAIFAIAASILMLGVNSALKVMGNSHRIKEASQSNASGLDTYDSPLGTIEGASPVTTVSTDNKKISFAIGGKPYSIKGVFQTATSTKKNSTKEEMTMKVFVADNSSLVTPVVPTPAPAPTPWPVPVVPQKGDKDALFNSEFMNTSGSINKAFKKGVVDSSVPPSNPPFKVVYSEKFTENEGSNEGGNQLFFVNEPVFSYNKESEKKQALGVKQQVDFLYFAGGNINTLIVENMNDIYKSYGAHYQLLEKKAGKGILLYVKNKLTITVDYYFKAENTNPDIKGNYELSANTYYHLPTNTELIHEAIAPDKFMNKYEIDNPNSGYKITDYDTLVKELNTHDKPITDIPY